MKGSENASLITGYVLGGFDIAVIKPLLKTSAWRCHVSSPEWSPTLFTLEHSNGSSHKALQHIMTGL